MGYRGDIDGFLELLICRDHAETFGEAGVLLTRLRNDEALRNSYLHHRLGVSSEDRQIASFFGISVAEVQS